MPASGYISWVFAWNCGPWRVTPPPPKKKKIIDEVVYGVQLAQKFFLIFLYSWAFGLRTEMQGKGKCPDAVNE